MHLELPLVGAEIGVAGGSNSADFLNEGLEKIYCIDNWATIGTVGDMAYPQQWHDDNYALTVESLSQFDSSRYTILNGTTIIYKLFLSFKTIFSYIPNMPLLQSF